VQPHHRNTRVKEREPKGARVQPHQTKTKKNLNNQSGLGKGGEGKKGGHKFDINPRKRGTPKETNYHKVKGTSWIGHNKHLQLVAGPREEKTSNCTKGPERSNLLRTTFEKATEKHSTWPLHNETAGEKNKKQP